jgi:hypothetical protein
VPDADLDRPTERARRVQQRPDQHAEADEESDLGLDPAEAERDGLDRPGEADAAGETEVERAEDQGDHRVDAHFDDEGDDQDDGDGCVDRDDGDLLSLREGTGLSGSKLFGQAPAKCVLLPRLTSHVPSTRTSQRRVARGERRRTIARC